MRGFLFALMFGILFNQAAKADTTRDFVRMSCVPEAGLLDIEYRGLHDSVAGSPNAQTERDAALERAGFHNPRGLKFSCQLGDITYSVSSAQDETSERMCGASPEVYLTVTRGGSKFLSDVIFGDSCHQLPSVMRVTVGDGPQSWRGRETQVCYATGKDGDAVFCDWTFGGSAQFDKQFPIDEARIEQLVSHGKSR
jgi:hypothetical protein